jgi:Flp pilus assembly protein TadG
MKLIRKQKGQALVEIALVLPILLLLLFGIIEFARILNTYIMVSNASREIARCYSLRSNDTDIDNKLIDLVERVLVTEETSVITTSDSGVKTTTISDFNITITPESNVGEEEKVTVEINHEFIFITPIGGIAKLIAELSNKPTSFSSDPFKIEASTVMRIE